MHSLSFPHHLSERHSAQCVPRRGLVPCSAPLPVRWLEFGHRPSPIAVAGERCMRSRLEFWRFTRSSRCLPSSLRRRVRRSLLRDWSVVGHDGKQRLHYHCLLPRLRQPPPYCPGTRLCFVNLPHSYPHQLLGQRMCSRAVKLM